MTSEVITTVDEKLINQMSQVNEPVKVEEQQPEAENYDADVKEDKVSDEPVYQTSEDTKADNQTQVEASKDEFGNEVTPKKVYTEDEVNELIRQRLNRGHYAKERQEVEKPVQQQTQDQQGEENWEAQLEGFVKNTVKKLTIEEQQKAREAQERQMQVEFEDKMLRGMGRYKDFKDIVSKVPISDPMLLATRQMKDPAAFIYAASKTQAKELERIAAIQDPYYQAAEMGRLEEKMRKLRSGSTTPKPVSKITGDIENRENVRGNVDDLIRKDALKKFNRRY